MPVVNNVKVACEPCIRGHRATSCNHGRDRRLVPVRKPGRPLGEHHMRPSPLAISSEKHGCRGGGLVAVRADGEARGGHAAECRRGKMTPEADLQLPRASPCCSRSHTHRSTAASPSPAESQPVVDYASTPLPSPATTARSRHLSNGQTETPRNSRPATSLTPMNATACVSPHSFTFGQSGITRMYDTALEATFPWTPPEPAPQTPEYALPNITTTPATQPIGVNLPLCTHCAGQTPGIVQPQILVLNHLGQAQAWSPGITHSHETAGNAPPPQAVIVYVSVQPQATAVEQEPRDWVAARSVHNHTNEATIPRCFQPNMSDDLQTPSGVNLGWPGQIHTGTSQAIVGTSTNPITSEGFHGCTAWLQALPLSPTQMPFSCVDELSASLLSPAPEPAAWNSNLSDLYRHSGDALMSPLSGCRCGRQHLGGCDLGCVDKVSTGL